ncbi:MAG TPA: hypothetical protein VG734_11065 [Lacunisphaera sp.]|nr:hypothetical protein [Lacunisphaera sp.]
MTNPAFRFIPLFLAGCLAATVQLPAAADYALPYHFTTLAGTSSIGSQNGTHVAARFYSPRAVARDSAGNTFVVDNGNHTIRKITPSSSVTTFAGAPGLSGSADGTGAAARFDDPHDITVDSADNLYVTDTGNHTIRKITPAGVVTTLAGLAGVTGNNDGPGTLARFNSPLGITADATGNIFVTESGNNTIRKITPAGAVSTFARNLTFRDPYYYAIAADAAGNAYVARYITRTYSNYSINGVLQAAEVATDIGYLTKVAPDGTLTYLLQSNVIVFHPEGQIPPINTPITDVLVEADGELLLAVNGRIVHFVPATGTSSVVSGSGIPGSADGNAANAQFSGLLGLAVDREGVITIADTGNNNVRRISANGISGTLAGLALDQASGFADGSGSAARFQSPVGVAVDAAGNTYVADHASHCIRKVGPTGDVTLLAGSPGVAGSVDGRATAARFSSPRGVAVGADGTVFVADSGNHTIRRISPTGETDTYAGSAGNAGTEDGPGASARLDFPRGVALDAAGNLYVTAGSTVRKITPAREVSTLAGNPTAFGFRDGPGSTAEFTWPTGIAVDASGNVYVTEVTTTIARLRKITPAGVVTTLAGGDPGTNDGNGLAARFHDPVGLACDGTGNLFIADSFNQTVRRVTPQGTVTTLAGLVDAPGSSDGAGAEARFYYPQGIAVDVAGKLRVSSGTTVRLGQAATGPTIAIQPEGKSVTVGATTGFGVAATSFLPLTYQWQKNGVDIAGATEAAINFSPVTANQAGDYTVIVSNSLGSVTSAKATLTVLAAPVPPPASGGGGSGGGGAPSSWFMFGLFGLGIVRGIRAWCQKQTL